MQITKSWKDQALRLKPFDGHLIPVFGSGHRKGGKITDHNFTVEEVLSFSKRFSRCSHLHSKTKRKHQEQS